MTDTMPDGAASAAACMDSPRSLTSLRPSSNVNAPANVRAVYSPSDSPAATLAAATASSPCSARSFSTAARDAT